MTAQICTAKRKAGPTVRISSSQQIEARNATATRTGNVAASPPVIHQSIAQPGSAAAKIPRPPPRGVTRVWLLRAFGTSSTCQARKRGNSAATAPNATKHDRRNAPEILHQKGTARQPCPPHQLDRRENSPCQTTIHSPHPPSP